MESNHPSDPTCESNQLHEAAGRGDDTSVRALIAAGDDVNLADESGQTPLHLAASGGTNQAAEEAIAFFLDAPMYLANPEGRIKAMRTLIAAGADVNVADVNGRTPLQEAASQGLTEAVQVLVSAGAWLDPRDQVGITSLHTAAQFGYTRMALALLAAGADPNARDWKGRTPLHKANANDHTETAQAFIRAGAFSYP